MAGVEQDELDGWRGARRTTHSCSELYTLAFMMLKMVNLKGRAYERKCVEGYCGHSEENHVRLALRILLRLRR